MINPNKITHWKSFTGTVFVSHLDISKEELIEHGYPNFIEVQMEDGAIIRYWIDACVAKESKISRNYELRKCPFCKAEAKIISCFIKGRYEIDCDHDTDCPLYFADWEPNIYKSKKEAMKIWNGECK